MASLTPYTPAIIFCLCPVASSRPLHMGRPTHGQVNLQLPKLTKTAKSEFRKYAALVIFRIKASVFAVQERERLKTHYSTQHDLKITKRGSMHGDKKVGGGTHGTVIGIKPKQKECGN